MSAPRFFVPSPIVESELALPPAAAHHALRVLRLRPGDPVVLFDGRGGEWRGRILSAGSGGVIAAGLERDSAERASPLTVTLAQALPGGDKMDWVVQKAVELGAAAIQPVESARCVVRLDAARADKRRRHWQEVAVAACEQSGLNRVPEVRPLASLSGWLSRPDPAALRLRLAPDAERSLRELEAPAGPVVLLIGPEGGFTDGEAQAAETAGFIPVRLGPRVLRTETAGLAALAALQALWGDF